MKNFYLSLLYTVSALLAAGQQDSTRVLFIGNSFTYSNNMPQMFKAFADAAGKPVVTGAHTPGGATVGEISQGSFAHMNNPAVYQLIRSQKWDFVVIQDNQGAFVYDSTVFHPAHLVVKGHTQLMDSVKANNSCAKIVLFCGWAFKNGYPPYGNTGTEMIDRISKNYCFLNSTMQEVIAPIGEAWKKSIPGLPNIDLWDPDEAHPAYPGSYLTAAVIFSTIFQLPAANNTYAGTLSAGVGQTLRMISDSVVFDSRMRTRYNLDGVQSPLLAFQNGILSVTGNYTNYKWYQNGTLIGSSPTVQVNSNGDYKAVLKNANKCILKTCVLSVLDTDLDDLSLTGDWTMFPNPCPAQGKITIEAKGLSAIRVLDACGRVIFSLSVGNDGQEVFQLPGLAPGIYVVHLVNERGIETFRKLSISGTF